MFKKKEKVVSSSTDFLNNPKNIKKNKFAINPAQLIGILPIVMKNKVLIGFIVVYMTLSAIAANVYLIYKIINLI